MFIPWFRNQSLTIEQQLQIGVRWFDLRLSYYNNDVYLSHTFIMNSTFESIMESFKHTSHPIIIQLRVDFNNLSKQTNVCLLTNTILEKYSDLFLLEHELDEDTIFTKNCVVHPSNKRILLYCSDGTIKNTYTISKNIMPTVSFWSRGTIAACEKALEDLEGEFNKINNSIDVYLFPNRRMIIFDYSSMTPLCITDRQQTALIKKYADTIKKANVSIFAGNYIQTICDLLDY
jgi:hypothetical protein